MSKETKQEREESLKNNEKALFAPFYKSAGFWGFDNLILTVSIVAIDEDLLFLRKGRRCTYTIGPAFKHLDAKPEERFNTIRICDPSFGEFFLSSGNGNPHAKCIRLELIHGGMNSETVGIPGLLERYTKAKKLLLGYGIKLSDNPSVYSSELAFTLACDKKIPVEVLKLILYAFSKSTNITTETYSNIGAADDIHKLSSKKSKNCKDVAYNKGAKAKKERKIQTYNNDGIQIYRFERTLMKNQLINNEFIGTSILNQLNDSMFYDYINHMLDEAINYYVNHICVESLDFFRKSLKAARLVSSQNYLAPLKDLLTAPLAKNYEEHVIDCETIVHANYNRIFPSDNIARAKRTIISSSLQKFDRLQNMYGWEFERMISWMRSQLTRTLGCPQCIASESLKSFHVANGQYSNKQDYLNNLIRSKRKNVHLNYAGLVIDRIDHHWKDFESKSMIELDLPDKKRDVNSFIYKK